MIANLKNLSKDQKIKAIMILREKQRRVRANKVLTHLDVFAPFRTTDKRYNLSFGGRGSGKSHELAITFIDKIRGKDYFRGVIMREVLGDIRDSQFRELCDLIEESGIEDEFTILKNTMTIVHNKTRNRIISKGFKKSAGKQTAKVKSIKDPTDIWVEEADEISHEDFIKADTSVRTKKSKGVRIWLTFNPEDAESWIKKVYCDKVRDDTLIVHSTYLDNLSNLQQSYVDALEMLKDDDSEWYAVFVLGQWGVKKVVSPFAGQYKKGKHEAKVKHQPIHNVFFSIDFNVNPFGCIVFQKWHDSEGPHCHVINEFTIPAGTTSAMAKMMTDGYARDLHMTEITGDHMGMNAQINRNDNNALFTDLRNELGLHENQLRVPANPRHKKSGNDVNYFLMHFPDFKINPVTCPNLCRDMKIVEVDRTGSIIKANRKDVSQKADHLDCFVGSTKVATDIGHIRIDEIKVGDMVLTRGGFKPVTDVWSQFRPSYTFTFESGTEITCTKDHRFATDQLTWMPIGKMHKKGIAGIQLINKQLVSVKPVAMRYSGVQRVYDITVDEDHEFFANEILVHNCLRYMVNTYYAVDIERHQTTGYW